MVVVYRVDLKYRIRYKYENLHFDTAYMFRHLITDEFHVRLRSPEGHNKIVVI